MRGSIIIKGKTKKEAIQKALSILQAELNEVDIQVLTPEGKSIFGLLKKEAVVKVSRMDLSPPESNKGFTEDEMNKILYESSTIPIDQDDISEKEELKNILN